MATDKSKPAFFKTPAEFRAWLKKNHAKETELLVGFYKTNSGKPSITWPESVDEALCFGWIDGVRKSLGEEAYTIRFTPRKKNSIWSAVNLKKMEELTKSGRMQPAGRKIFEERNKEKTNIYSFEQKEAHKRKLDPASEKKMKANKKAWAFYTSQAPWYQRVAAFWVISAKKEETRQKRLETLIRDSEAGRRIGQLTGPKSAQK